MRPDPENNHDYMGAALMLFSHSIDSFDRVLAYVLRAHLLQDNMEEFEYIYKLLTHTYKVHQVPQLVYTGLLCVTLYIAGIFIYQEFEKSDTAVYPVI